MATQTGKKNGIHEFNLNGGVETITETKTDQEGLKRSLVEDVRQLGIQVFLSSLNAGLGMQIHQCWATAEELLTGEIRLQK